MENHKLNILFLASWYPSREHATIGNFVQRHAKAVALLHHIVVVSAHESAKSGIESTTEGNLTEIRVYFKKKAPLLSYHKALKKGVKKARENHTKFDLAHVHVAYPAGVMALRLNLPYLVTEHFSGYHKTSGFKWNYTRMALTRRILNKAKKVLPVSDHLGRAIKLFGVKSPMEKVSNVVDTSIFHPKEESRNEVFTFLHISTLEERSKNITGILRGFKELEKLGHDFKLQIGGDGNLRELREKISEYGPSTGKVEIIEEQSIDGIAKLMQQADCLVMFSHFENQPCTILEAMCTGTPVVSSDVGGIPEVIDDSNGILVPAENEERFAEALALIQNKYSEYNPEEISKTAASLYSYQSVAHKLNKIFINVLK